MIEQVVNNLIEKSGDRIRVEEGDYLNEDGLLVCGKCHTLKQTEVTFMGKTRRPYCRCKCESEKRDREEAERKNREMEHRIAERRRIGFPDAEMRAWNFANDDMANEKITKAMQSYVAHFADFRRQGKGLLLYGNCGTGKTYAACEVANALIDRDYSVLVTNFARVLNTLQGTFEKQKYIDSLNKYQLLVIDDLGIERDTQFAKEQVFNIIDSRYRVGLPMIITTNLSMEKIKNPDDIENARIYDRILERCFPIEVTGGSRRRKAVIESYNEMQELLGLK